VKRHTGIAFVIFLSLVISPLTFAADKAIVKTQGVVMAVDLKKSEIVINERKFVLNGNTTFFNERGYPVTVEMLKPKTWVYIEGTDEKAKRRVFATKIYFLPKRIDGKEKDRYPFLK
jgi:hypothetical protein